MAKAKTDLFDRKLLATKDRSKSDSELAAPAINPRTKKPFGDGRSVFNVLSNAERLVRQNKKRLQLEKQAERRRKQNLKKAKIEEKKVTVQHVATPELLRAITQLSAIGLTKAQVASAIGWSRHLFTNRLLEIPELMEALEKGRAMGVKEVAHQLFVNATENNNVSAQIFFLKTRGGFKEEIDLNLSTDQLQIKDIGDIWSDDDKNVIEGEYTDAGD